MPKQLAIKMAAAGLSLSFLAGGLSAPAALCWPLALILGLSLVSCLASPLPATGFFGEYASYQGWFHWAALAFLLLALPREIHNRRGRREFLVATVLSLTLIAVYALFQLIGLDFTTWQLKGPLLRAFSTSGNPLYLGFLLSLGLPAALGLALLGRTWPARLGWLAAASLLFAGLLATGSRGPLIGAIVGSGFLFFAVRRHSRSAARFGGQAIMVGIITMIVCGIFLPRERNPFPLLVSRFASLASGDDSRPAIWNGAARLIKRSPIIGSGLDSFAALNSQVQSPRLWDFVWRGSPEKAHNEILQLAATGGLLVTGAALWLLAVLVRLVSGRAVEKGAAAGSLLALALAGQIGFITCAPQAVALLFAALLACELPMRPLPKAAVYPAGLVFLAGLLFNLHFAAGEVALKRAVADGGRSIDRALKLKTPWAQRLFRAGDTLEHRYFGSALDIALKPGQASGAGMLLRIYKEARRINPLYSNSESNLARMAARAGRIDEALAGYSRARALAPMDAYLAIEQSRVLLEAGDEAEAIHILQGVSALYPDFAEPLGLLGYIRLRSGDQAGAEIMLSRSLNLNWRGNFGAASAAARNLAAIYHLTGREIMAARAAQIARRFEHSKAGL